jgi:PRTRC genetic system protein C
MKTSFNKRVFKYNNMTLDDPNPSFTNEQVLNHYSALYPELNNAIIEDKGDHFLFKSSFGAKG